MRSGMDGACTSAESCQNHAWMDQTTYSNKMPKTNKFVDLRASPMITANFLPHPSADRGRGHSADTDAGDRHQTIAAYIRVSSFLLSPHDQIVAYKL